MRRSWNASDLRPSRIWQNLKGGRAGPRLERFEKLSHVRVAGMAFRHGEQQCAEAVAEIDERADESTGGASPYGIFETGDRLLAPIEGIEDQGPKGGELDHAPRDPVRLCSIQGRIHHAERRLSRFVRRAVKLRPDPAL